MNITEIFLASLKFAVIIPMYIMCVLPVKEFCKIQSKTFFPVSVGTLGILSIVSGTLKVFFSLKTVILLIPLVLLTMLSYFAFYRTDKLKMWYLFISSAAITSFSSLISYTVEAVVRGSGYSSDVQTYGLIAQWVTVAIFFTAYIAALHKIKWLIESILLNNIWKFVWIVPVLIITTNIIMVPFNYSNTGTERFAEIYATVIFILLILFVLFEVMLYIVAKAVSDKATAEQQANMMSIQAKEYGNLKKYIESTSRLRHDFLHMARAAGQLAKNNDTEALIKLLEEYGVSIENSHSRKIFCEHVALNAVIGHYYNEALKNSIKCDWKIAVPSKIALSDTELCSIAGNLLDNAIQGCQTVDEITRYISFNIDIEQNGDIFIVMTNSFDGVVNKTNEKYATTKTNGNGIGLESIKTTVDNHNGYVRFYNDKKNFYTDIMIKQD